MQKKYAIGIDLGGTNMRVALVSREGTVVKKVKEPISEDLTGSLLHAIAGIFSDEVAGIGIGVAGLIGKQNRRVLSPRTSLPLKRSTLPAKSERIFCPCLY